MTFAQIPTDPTSTDRLASQGLEYGLVDQADRDRFTAWLQADMRGFYAPRMNDEVLGKYLDGFGDRRVVAVRDEKAVDAASPVATLSSWEAPLTVPGGDTIRGWSISSVTVAPTHRRRGIARNLLEGELRAAKDAGFPLAMLTVTEATIYGRYGFAPAASAQDITVETRRAGWAGPASEGSLHFVELDRFRDEIAGLYERVRLHTPGEVGLEPLHWLEATGAASDDKAIAQALRAVRFTDAAGELRGYVLYQVKRDDSRPSGRIAEVGYLLAETEEARSALWRFLIELDLVTEVKASLRPLDEPLPWQLVDRRAVTATRVYDHLWLRVLDVARTFEARSYAASGRLVLEVDDALGHAAGRYLLEVDEAGAATVTEALEGTDAPALALTAAELGALYLGGTSATTLARAGRVRELAEGAAAAADSLLRSERAPWLSIWF